MKHFFTLIILIAGNSTTNAQAILNEVYAIPGNSRQEFFEFYNSSASALSMDNYTIVTYFEEGAKKGFYVLDLPDLTVSGRQFFVGSSKVPFDYQGINNSTASQFSWNDISFLSSHNAYLQKWVLGTAVSTDGNAYYDLEAIPSNFNDFFNKISGSQATYNVFIYRNGMLQSIFLGGTGGATFLPNYILSLPNLFVDMSGSSPDFTINFSGYTNTNPEYVTQDVGTDNGYIRLRDGVCGSWTKSSAQVNHSPGVSNGGFAEGAVGEISISSIVIKGSPSIGSTVFYDAVAAPANEFPLTIQVYVDNGMIAGQLDAGDTFVESKTENTVSDGPFTTAFFPYTANIILQTISSAGCIDNERFVQSVTVLPVKLISFQGIQTPKGNLLNWTIAENESAQLFEVEKSTDGKNFVKLGTVNSSGKPGVMDYRFTDPDVSTASYRIKLMGQSFPSSYSKVILIQHKQTEESFLQLLTNPVNSYLKFTCISSSSSIANISIYTISGKRVYYGKASLVQGNNSITIATDSWLATGVYVLQIATDRENSCTKFIKQ